MTLFNWKHVRNIFFGSCIALSIVACKPDIECNDQIDGKSLLADLKESNKSEVLSRDITTLATQCKLNSAQISELNIHIARFVQGATEEAQSKFYKAILSADATIKSNFIKISPIFSQANNTEVFKIIDEFKSLGKGLKEAKLTNAERAVLKNLPADEIEALAADDNFRIIGIGKNSVRALIQMTTELEPNGMTESLSIYKLGSGEKIMSDETINSDNVIGGTGKNAFATKFIVDSKGNLRYLFSAGKNSHPNFESDSRELVDCGAFTSIKIITSDGTKQIERNHKTDVSCANFEEYELNLPAAKVLQKISAVAGIKNNAEYVNFSTKDVADNELVNSMLKQGNQGLLNLLGFVKEKIPKNSLFFKFKPDGEIILDNPDNLNAFLKAAKDNVENANWILKGRVDKEFYQGFVSSFSEIDYKIKEINDGFAELNSMRQKIDDATANVEKFKTIRVQLIRELNREDDGFISTGDRKYGYLAMRIPAINYQNSAANLILIYSNKNLFNGRPYIAFSGEELVEKIRWKMNGFSNEISQYEASELDPEASRKIVATGRELQIRISEQLHEVENALMKKFFDLINQRNAAPMAQSS